MRVVFKCAILLEEGINYPLGEVQKMFLARPYYSSE